MLVPSKHTDALPVEDAGLCELPIGWATTTMGEIATIVGGGTPKTSEPDNFEGGEIPWITPADLSGYGSKSISRGARNITAKGLKRSSARLLPAGAVLLSTRAPIGYVAIASQPVATNQGFKSFVLANGLNSSFVYHYLLSARQLLDSLGGGTTFKELSGADAATIPLPLPPPGEQHRIVAEIEKQFTRLDASAASLKRVHASLRRYRASVLKAACEGRLVPIEAELAKAEGRDYEHASVLLERILAKRRARWESQENRRGKKYKEPVGPDTSDLPELPEGWVWATATQLGEVRLGRQRSPKRATGPHMRPYLRAANVTWDGLDLSDVKEMDFSPREYEIYRLCRGDILLAEASGSADEVGKPAIWADQIDGCCFQNTLIRVRAFPTVAPYLYYHLLSDARTGALGRAARGVGIHHLGAQRTESWAVALPPLAEQHRIVAEVDRRLSVMQQAETTVEASLTRAERLRQSILKQAFSGKLVPQDPNDEPASALLERIRAEREEAEVAARANGRPRRGRSKKPRGRQHTRSEAAP